MKIIEAMKKIKNLEEKAVDLQKKVALHCADLSYEQPVYPDQKQVVAGWIQAQHDLLKECEKLRVAIQKTNLNTPVTIELDGVQVTKSIAEWVLRRRLYAKMEEGIWNSLNDRGLKEGITDGTAGQKIEVKIRRYFDPVLRDEKRELYRSEPSVIDSTLEVVNAVIDLIED